MQHDGIADNERQGPFQNLLAGNKGGECLCGVAAPGDFEGGAFQGEVVDIFECQFAAPAVSDRRPGFAPGIGPGNLPQRFFQRHLPGPGASCSACCLIRWKSKRRM